MPDMETEDRVEQQSAPPGTLTKDQRRVLGVLLEKAFTTPEYYPLTLKALTAGCNQKSNRDPITSYSEESVEQTIDELRELGLVAVVHTESGRTERYRHYVRKRYPYSEEQMAIVTELLLRGRQQLGELRSRASRMVPIDGLDALRRELTGLQELGYVQADGPLERRGIEVDHAFYPETEAARAAGVPRESGRETVAGGTEADGRPLDPDRLATLEATVAELLSLRTQLTEEVESLREDLRRVSDELQELRTALGS